MEILKKFVLSVVFVIVCKLCWSTSSAARMGSIRGLSGPESISTHSQVTQKRTPNTFTELRWKKSCTGSYYDFFATLYFCEEHQANNTAMYGYKPHPNDPCRSEKNNPLIRLQAGVRYRLTLVNTMEENRESTNLHLHGVHISGFNDRVWDQISPGNCLHYNWTIPEDHMEGAFLYHAHGFQTARKQLNHGAYGIGIVDPSPSELPDSDRPHFLTRERLLLLATRRDLSFSRVLYHSANGLREYNAVLDMEQGVWHYLSILVMDPVADVRSISFDESACQVRAASYDGIWRSTVPSPREQYEFGVTGASRLGVAIKCSSSSTIQYYPNSDFPALEVELRISSSKKSSEEELESWVPQRPQYLRSLLDEPLSPESRIDGESGGDFRVIMTDDSFNHVTFSVADEPPPPILSLPLNAVHEFEIDYSQYHPFHMHVQAFQVASPQGCGNIFEYGEFYDTLSAAMGDQADEKVPCLIRFATHISGPTLVHCHSLNHEGAMAWIQVAYNDDINHQHEKSGMDPLQNYDDQQCASSESLTYWDVTDCSKA